MRGSFRSLKV